MDIKIRKALEFGFRYQVNCELTPDQCKEILDQIDEHEEQVTKIGNLAEQLQSMDDLAKMLKEIVSPTNENELPVLYWSSGETKSK